MSGQKLFPLSGRPAESDMIVTFTRDARQSAHIRAGTGWNLCGNLPRMRAPVALVRKSIAMLVLELVPELALDACTAGAFSHRCSHAGTSRGLRQCRQESQRQPEGEERGVARPIIEPF